MSLHEVVLVVLLGAGWWLPVAAVVAYRRRQRAQRRAWTLVALEDARRRVTERAERKIGGGASPISRTQAVRAAGRIIVAPRPARPNRILEELGDLESQSKELMAAIAHGLGVIEIAQRVAMLHAHSRHVRALLGETRPVSTERRA